MALPVVCVQESIADEFVALLKKKALELKLGPAYLGDSQLGPLVSAAQKQSVENWIARGVADGATLVLDGRGAKVPGAETATTSARRSSTTSSPNTPSAMRKSSGR